MVPHQNKGQRSGQNGDPANPVPEYPFYQRDFFNISCYKNQRSADDGGDIEKLGFVGKTETLGFFIGLADEIEAIVSPGAHRLVPNLTASIIKRSDELAEALPNLNVVLSVQNYKKLT